MHFEALILLDRITRTTVAILGAGAFHQHDFPISAPNRVQAKQADGAVRNDLVHGFAYYMTGENVLSYRHAIRYCHPLLMLDLLKRAEAAGGGPQIIEGDRIDVRFQRLR
ncbi:hypothetical protein D3C85_1481300 [compost metagenome]